MAQLAMDSTDLRALILTTAQKVCLELQGDRIRLQIPANTALDRSNTGPYARALRRYIPEIKIEEWDAEESDSGRQPTAYSLERTSLSKYAHWARCLGVPEEILSLPAWLRPLGSEPPLNFEEPRFFSEATAGQLKQFQKQAIRFGIQRAGRLLLADDVALGKSVQALGIAWQYEGAFPLLILCSKLQVKMWQQQVSRWTPTQSVDVEIVAGSMEVNCTARLVIASYAQLEKFEELQSASGTRYKVVIADECHCIKHDALKSKALIRIASLAERLILVSSGGPVLKSAIDFHPLLQMLDPNIGSKDQFIQRYFDGTTSKLLRQQELSSYLFKLIGVRRRKDEVLNELPPIRRQTILLLNSGCSLSAELRQMEVEMFRQKPFSDQESKQGRLSEMKRVSHLVMQNKRRSCVDYLREFICNGVGKFLLFAYHREMLDALESVLNETLGITGYIRIDGQTPSHERENLLSCFQEDSRCQAALLSLTGCQGPSLSAEALIFAELAWAPGILRQCEDKVASGSVLIRYLLLEGCQWDRHCYDRLQEKRRQATEASNMAWEDREAAPRWKPLATASQPTVRKQDLQTGQESACPVVNRPSSQLDMGDVSEQHAKEGQGELYKVVEHLHLGLNLKLHQCYTKDALEKKCQGNQYKLKRLRDFMTEAKKLHLVSAAFNPNTSSSQMVRPPKRQKRGDSRWVDDF